MPNYKVERRFNGVLRMLGFYNYTVVLTYVGLVSTVIGISEVLAGNYINAMLCLLFSGTCDMFDGVVARKCTKRSEDAKKFGIQIDSLCDVICFGVFPAIFNYAYCISVKPGMRIIALTISAFFALTAVIRLAYFNVTEEKRQQETSEVRKYYQGLPVTSVAGLLPLLFIFRGLIDTYFYIVLSIFTVVVGVLFIYDFKMPKPHKRGLIIMTVCGAAIIAILLLQKYNIFVWKPII